jgi:hypothetical protein
MPGWYRLNDSERDSFLNGFRAGFDVSREGFNRERARKDRAPRPEHLRADPKPQKAVDAIFGLLAARALVITQCEHARDATRYCVHCKAAMRPYAASERRRA